MGLTKEDLLAHSRYIRDTLAPRIATGKIQAAGEHAFDLTHLRSALEELEKTTMNLATLRFSRMEKALQRIIEAPHGRWPPDIVVKAQNLINRWEETIGPLQKVRSDLWASGGRLEGLGRPKRWFKWHGVAGNHGPATPTFDLERSCDLSRAHQHGHAGFQVGDWWLNCAAACRDGIVDNPHYRITAGKTVAYAIAMTQGNETGQYRDDSCSYTPLPGDLGVFRLMTTVNGQERKVLRVLRSWKLQSPLAPAAGVRYDGLYRVVGYGIKLVHSPETGQDSWRYTFHLKREEGQESMAKALTYPMPDQLDDWDDYRNSPNSSPSQEPMEGKIEDPVKYHRDSGIEVESPVGRIGSIDSGYFSPHPSLLKD
ncbi:MAG: hypothetical protein Q9220_004305 [cf. Caloplaca sp. 1 TL-2023]